jgi:ribosome-binding protein aMBF1 (putative translation factor)
MMLRSSFVSLFWTVLQNRGLKLQWLADKLNVDKSAVSHWFSTQPNWTIDTIADIAYALELELKVTAVDRSTGIAYTANGPSNRLSSTDRPGSVENLQYNPTIPVSASDWV